MSIAGAPPSAARLNGAEALLRAGRAVEAWQAAAPLRQAIDQSSPQLRSFAGIAIAAGQVDPAVDALRRAATIEGDPPDLIGGIADLLESAGRFDESLTYWDRLAALRPDLVDAHLNRAITADKAGRHDRAIDAADAGLKRFPGHARLLAVRAMALKNAGRLDDALATFDQAIVADPDRALTRYNQAVTLRAAMRFDESCEAYQTAARLGLHGAEFHANWAAAALEAGRVGQAEQLYRRALDENPAEQQALRALTRLKIEYLEDEDGFDHYETSCEARGSSIEAWIDWIGALSANYRLEQAAEVGRRAQARHPGEPTLIARTAIAEGMSGDASAALDRLSRLPAELNASPASTIGRAQLAIRAGDPALGARLAEEYTRHQPAAQLGWAVLGIAWRLTGDPREQWLCDYERLVMVTDVPSPCGLGAAEHAA
ncbi:MAG: tetratricopeptide repeat protein, partial [Sphingomicrobium sp.]